MLLQWYQRGEIIFEVWGVFMHLLFKISIIGMYNIRNVHCTAVTLKVPCDVILHVAQIQISKKLVKKGYYMYSIKLELKHACSINIFVVIKDMN